MGVSPVRRLARSRSSRASPAAAPRPRLGTGPASRERAGPGLLAHRHEPPFSGFASPRAPPRASSTTPPRGPRPRLPARRAAGPGDAGARHRVAAGGGEEGPEARVRVYRAHDGAELDAPGPDGPLWFGHLPGTGDYVIRVTAPAERAVGYTLAVQIPRRLILDSRASAKRGLGRAPSRAPRGLRGEGHQGTAVPG